MPESLTTQIAERLDISPDQTNRVLRTLARLIKKQSERDGRVRVPGLGIFEQTNGTLAFEPDRQLAEAVNRPYAALDSVPVAAPPPDQPPSTETEDAAEEAPQTPPPAPAAGEETSETASSTLATEEERVIPPPLPAVPEAAEMPNKEASDESPEPSEEELEEASVEPNNAEPLSAPAKPKTENDAFEWAPPGTRWKDDASAELTPEETSLDQPADQEEAAPPPQSSRSRPERDLPPEPRRTPYARSEPLVPERRSRLPWIVLVLFLVLAAVAAYLYLDRRQSPQMADEMEQTPVEPAPAEETPADVPPDESEAGETPAEDTEAEDTSAPAQPEQEAPAAVGPSGIDRTVGGYTLIVGSRAEAAPAEQAAARYREQLADETIPVDVLQGTSDGVTRYRIAIGQVDTIDDALALKERLGDRIPSDAWVTRILPDTN